MILLFIFLSFITHIAQTMQVDDNSGILLSSQVQLLLVESFLNHTELARYSGSGEKPSTLPILSSSTTSILACQPSTTPALLTQSANPPIPSSFAIKKPWKCVVTIDCNAKFNTKMELFRHLKADHAGIDLICSYCNKQSKGLLALNQHIKACKQRTILCPVENCTGRYKSSHALNVHHVERHDHARAKECVCNKFFACDARLKAHQSYCKVFNNKPNALSSSVRSKLRLSSLKQ